MTFSSIVFAIAVHNLGVKLNGQLYLAKVWPCKFDHAAAAHKASHSDSKSAAALFLTADKLRSSCIDSVSSAAAAAAGGTAKGCTL